MSINKTIAKQRILEGINLIKQGAELLINEIEGGEDLFNTITEVEKVMKEVLKED